MRLLRTVLTRPEGSTQRDKMKPGFRGKKKETHGGQDGTHALGAQGCLPRFQFIFPLSLFFT